MIVKIKKKTTRAKLSLRAYLTPIYLNAAVSFLLIINLIKTPNFSSVVNFQVSLKLS